MKNKYLPLLVNGEEYTTSISKDSNSPHEPKLPDFSEACLNLFRDIELAQDVLRNISDKFIMNEIIFKVSMVPGLIAKSYYLDEFFNSSNFEKIGSELLQKNNQDKPRRVYYIKSTRETLSNFRDKLSEPSKIKDKLKRDIQKISGFEYSEITNVDNSFQGNWQEGKVEFVLHNFINNNDLVINKFLFLLENTGVILSNVRYKIYDNGPIFLSCLCNRNQVNELSKFNPARYVHPFEVRLFMPRSEINCKIPLPLPPKKTSKSNILVGVFDGGVNVDNKYLTAYSIEYNPLNNLLADEYLEHGTSVAGLILYGSLNNHDNYKPLPNPIVNVESYRVLPTSNIMDMDLYESIDIIEKVVPERHDIHVYNLSFGPVGPISNKVSRFTYALDKLAIEYNKLFCVAVGNDGDLEDNSLRRIQSPSDLVNGLGIGSSSKYMLDFYRAPYSCIGPGREGAKVKPDLIAFGGCENTPTQLINLEGTFKLNSMGTSFSTPLISSKAAEIIGRLKNSNYLTAKALMIHHCDHTGNLDNKKQSFDYEVGYGEFNLTVDELLECKENRVTIICSGKILPKKYARINIPVIQSADFKGKVKITRTIVCSCIPNALDVDDYTSTSIESTFYPSSNTYRFTDPTNKKNFQIVNVNIDHEKASKLSEQNWSISAFPVSNSSKLKNEVELRNTDLKWDTVNKVVETYPYSSLEKPSIIIHGLSRSEKLNYEFINYVIVFTIEYIGINENAYDLTQRQYTKLKPANILAENEVIVSSYVEI
jgi:hypothetical protein